MKTRASGLLGTCLSRKLPWHPCYGAALRLAAPLAETAVRHGAGRGWALESARAVGWPRAREPAGGAGWTRQVLGGSGEAEAALPPARLGRLQRTAEPRLAWPTVTGAPRSRVNGAAHADPW